MLTDLTIDTCFCGSQAGVFGYVAGLDAAGGRAGGAGGRGRSPTDRGDERGGGGGGGAGAGREWDDEAGGSDEDEDNERTESKKRMERVKTYLAALKVSCLTRRKHRHARGT